MATVWFYLARFVALTVELKGYVLYEQYKYGTCPHIEAYYALVF